MGYIDTIIGYRTIGSIDNVLNPETGKRLYITNGVALQKVIIPASIDTYCVGGLYVDAFEEWGSICRPVVFSDDSNFPGNRISKNEQSYDVKLNYGSKRGKYWISADFELQQSLPANTPVWFGFFAEHFPPRFDYGENDYYIGYPANNTALNTPAVFPDNYRKNFLGKLKFSHYFYASSLSKKYVISLTQTVAPHDGSYRRGNCIRLAADGVKGIDRYSFQALLRRFLPETVTAAENVKRRGAFVRGLWEEVAGAAKAAVCGTVYCRTATETVRVHGTVFRGLLLFVKIFTTFLVRDFIVRRFLKSKEEMVLKSAVCREIVIESRL